MLTTLTAIPVMTWIKPRTREPSMMATVSSRGVNRAGISKVLSGLMIFSSWGIKSPRKPPVMTPMIVVLTPHQNTSSMKLRVPSRGFAFLRTNSAPKIMSRP